MFEDMLNWLNVGSEATATEGFDATEVAGPTKYVSSPRSESINKRRKEIEDSVIKNLKGNDQKEYGIAKYMSESEDEEEAAKGRELLKKYGKSQPVLDVIFESERWRQSQEIVNNIRARNELAKQNFENGKYDNPLEGEYYETLQSEGALINSGWWDALDFGVGMLGRRLVKTAAENTDFNSDTPEELIARFLDPNITSDQKRRMLTNCTSEQRAAVYSMLSDKAVNASVLEGDYAERIEEIEDMITNPDDTAKWSHGLALLDFAGLSTGFGTRTATALTKPFARRFSGMTKNADFVKFLKSGAKDILGAETSEIFEGLRAAGMTTDEAYQATNRAMYSAASEYLGWKDGKTLSLEMGEQIKTIGKAGILGFKEAGIRASIAADGIVANMIANGDFGSRAGRIWLSEGKSIDLGDDVMKSLRSLSMSGEAPTAENIGRAVWGQSYINAERAAMNESLMLTESEKNMLLRAKEIEDNIKLGSEYWLDADGLVKRKEVTSLQTIIVNDMFEGKMLPNDISVATEDSKARLSLSLSEIGDIDYNYEKIRVIYENVDELAASLEGGFRKNVNVSDIDISVKNIIQTETSPIKVSDLATMLSNKKAGEALDILTKLGVEDANGALAKVNEFIKANGKGNKDVISVINDFNKSMSKNPNALKVGSDEYYNAIRKELKNYYPDLTDEQLNNLIKVSDLNSDFLNIIVEKIKEVYELDSSYNYNDKTIFSGLRATLFDAIRNPVEPNDVIKAIHSNIAGVYNNEGNFIEALLYRIADSEDILSKISKYKNDSSKRVALDKFIEDTFIKVDVKDGIYRNSNFGSTLVNINGFDTPHLLPDYANSKKLVEKIFAEDSTMFSEYLLNVRNGLFNKGFKPVSPSATSLGNEVINKIIKTGESKLDISTSNKLFNNWLIDNSDLVKAYTDDFRKGRLTTKEIANKIVNDYIDSTDEFYISLREAYNSYVNGENPILPRGFNNIFAKIEKELSNSKYSKLSVDEALGKIFKDKSFFEDAIKEIKEVSKLAIEKEITKATVGDMYVLYKKDKDINITDSLREFFEYIDKNGGDINKVTIDEERLSKLFMGDDSLIVEMFKTDSAYRFDKLSKSKHDLSNTYQSVKFKDTSVYYESRKKLMEILLNSNKDSHDYKIAKTIFELQSDLARVYLANMDPGVQAFAMGNLIGISDLKTVSNSTFIHEMIHTLTSAYITAYLQGTPHTTSFVVEKYIKNTWQPNAVKHWNEALKANPDMLSDFKNVMQLFADGKSVPTSKSFKISDYRSDLAKLARKIRKNNWRIPKDASVEELSALGRFTFFGNLHNDMRKGSTPLFTHRAKINYGFSTPHELPSVVFESDDVFNRRGVDSKTVSDVLDFIKDLGSNYVTLYELKNANVGRKSIIGNIFNMENIANNKVGELLYKSPEFHRQLLLANDTEEAIAIAHSFVINNMDIKSDEIKIINKSFSDYIRSLDNDKITGEWFKAKPEIENLVERMYKYMVDNKLFDGKASYSELAKAVENGKFNKEINYFIVESVFDEKGIKYITDEHKRLLKSMSHLEQYEAMKRLKGPSDDAVVNSITESHKNFADRAEQKINDGWHQFFDDTMAKPYNPIAQLNPSVPANSSTRAQATFEALSGEDYTSIGLNKDETIMSTFGPSVGEKKQPVDIEEVANLLIENSVDITTDEEKRRLIKDIKEQLSKCNASSVDVSIEGSFERIVGTFSNEANTGFDTVYEAKVMRDSALNELKELGLAEQEISIMGADVNGNLSPIQDGIDYSKYYLQITHSNDISNMLTGSSEAVMKVSGIFDANPLTRFVRDNTASASRIFGEDLIRPLVAGYEKLTGIQDIAFSRDVADFKKAFNKISGSRQNKVYETIMKQNARGVKEGTLFSEKDLRAMGHTSEEIEALTKLWDLNEKIWDYKNLNNARKLKQIGYVAIDTDKGTMVGRKVSGKLDTNSKVFEPSTGIEIGVEHVNPDYMDIYEFATDRGSRGTNYFIVPKSVKSRAINWKFDQTMGKIPGYTDMRLKESLKYIDKDGKTFAVARDTLDAEAYAKKMGWTDGEYVIRGDARGKGTGLGSRSQQRDGIELAGNLTWSDAYINPLEAVDQGLSYAMRQTEITPIIEQAQRNFIQVYGKYTKGVYPTSMSAIEGKDQMANAARSVYNYIERIKGAESKNMIDDAFKATMNHIAENLGKWALESGGAMADVYALGERAALNMARMNPLTWSRHRVSQFYIAAHPIRQFLLQGVQLSNAMAVDAKSVLSGKMMSQMIDLTLAATGTKNVSRENAHMFDLFKRMGLMSSESSVAWIQEALKVAPGSKWDGAMEKLGKGALYGEKMQVLGQACCEYNKTVRQFGKEWFNNKKNFDSFIEKVRITTGSQNPAERMPWENGVLGVIFQFVQSPWKMNQLIFSKQIPLRTRAGIALNELAVFGLGTYGTALVYDNVVGKQFGATLDDDTREIIKGGLFDNAVAKVFGMHFDTKNFAPTNYSDIVDWLVKACGYKETEAAKYIAGDWKKNDSLKHDKAQNYKDTSFLSQAGERMSIPVAGFAKYRLAPLIADVWGFMWGTEDNEPWSGAKAVDVAKDLVNMFSGSNAALKAYIASTTGNYLNRKGAHLKTGMDNRQALGMLLFTPEVTPEESSNARKELAYKDPDAYLTTAWDSAMHHVAGKLMNENLDKVETSEYIERMFGAMQILRQSWTNGDPKKEAKLKKHIEKRLKEAQEDPVSSHAWVLNWFTKRLEKGQKYYQDAMMRFKEQDPRAYQTVHDRIRAIERAQRIDFEEEEE